MKKTLLVSGIAVITAASFSANARQGNFYVNPAIGVLKFDTLRAMKSAQFGQLGLEYQFSDNMSVELAGFKADADLDLNSTPTRSADLTHYRLDGLYYLSQSGAFQPYLALGVGRDEFEIDTANPSVRTDYKENIADIGGGLRYEFGNNISTRLDLRGIHGLDSSRWDTMASLGLSYAFGGPTLVAAEPVADPEPVETVTEPVIEEPVKPADSDSDGVIDNVDQCPNTAAGVKVDIVGCPLDSDSDGVPDSEDKCDGTVAGDKVDASGCKVVAKTVRVEEVSIDVKFASNSAVVAASEYAEIERVADFMSRYPDLSVEIEGHTDSQGKASYNKSLSQRRADAVANVLVSRFGVDVTRVRSLGYGEEQPIADNSTASGRKANRRVVAVMTKEVVE